jgi:hypothetical protein
VGRGEVPKGSSRRSRRSSSRTSMRSKRGGRSGKTAYTIASASKEIAKEVVKRLGLDLIDVNVDDIIDIIENIVGGIVESRSSKPTLDSLMKRILASKDLLRKAIAAKLLERKGEDLNLDQVQFIVSYAPELAGRAAPQLYRIAKKYNADYIITALQALWNKYGLRTPIRCPRCGFYAVTPDLTCMVCGAVLDEDEIKRSMNFKDMLKRFLEKAPTPIVREIYQAGFVILNDEIEPPSMASQKNFKVEIHLNKEERSLVKKILEERGEA